MIDSTASGTSPKIADSTAFRDDQDRPLVMARRVRRALVCCACFAARGARGRALA